MKFDPTVLKLIDRLNFWRFIGPISMSLNIETAEAYVVNFYTNQKLALAEVGCQYAIEFRRTDSIDK